MLARTALSELPAAQRQRLSYIEYRIWFYGQVARKDIVQHFGVASAAGTRDLSAYRDLASENVCYERKAYRYKPSFSPLFEHKVEQVLAMLTAGFGVGEPAAHQDTISHIIPGRLNQPRLDTLATITRAIRGHYALQLTYYSVTEGPEHKEIVPHSIVDSGLRWHVRAFDRKKGRFRDLVLTRIEQPIPLQNSAGLVMPGAQEQIEADIQWNRIVALDFVPHPSQSHPKSIERDLAMRNGRLSVRIRAAVAGYMLRQWLVDCSPNASLSGPEYRLWLADAHALDGVANAVLAPGYEVPTSEIALPHAKVNPDGTPGSGQASD